MTMLFKQRMVNVFDDNVCAIIKRSCILNLFLLKWSLLGVQLWCNLRGDCIAQIGLLRGLIQNFLSYGSALWGLGNSSPRLASLVESPISLESISYAG